MKKVISILLLISIVFAFGACSKVKTDESASESESSSATYTPVNSYEDAFSGTTLVETDETNTITFDSKEDRFTEVYKGNTLEGTWKYDEQTDTMVLTYEGADYSYYFQVTRDDSDNITGFGQYEGRTFTIVSK